MAVPKKTGRPSTYNEEIADQICSELAMGKSLRTICSAPNMPGRETVFRWLRQKDIFRDQYARAKAEAADALFEDILDIADDASGDYDEEGRFRPENVQRARLRIDARKWMMARMKPKRYGDQVDLNVGGQEENPIRALIMSIQGSALMPVEDPPLDITPDDDEPYEGNRRIGNRKGE